MTAAIEITALTRKFDSLIAVDHLDLSVERGELFGLLGSNGALRWRATLREGQVDQCRSEHVTD